MCKPDKTYHCTVKKSNQTLVSEYDITVSREFTNVLDNNDTKQNDDINISDAETNINNKKDNTSLGVKIFFGFVFVLNVASILLFVGLIFIVIYFSNKDDTPALNKWLCITVCSIIVVFLISLLTAYYKVRKNKNVNLFPYYNTSFKSFGFHVITVSTIVGVLVSCISAFLTDYDSYTYAKYTIYYISLPFYVLSFNWIIRNLMKALKNNETDRDIAKLNQIIQFCVSVLTIIGVFMDKIDDYDSEIGFIYVYAFALALYLFAPFVISYCVDKKFNGLQSKS